MEEIERVPLAAYEAESERNHKTLRYLGLGWAVSIIVLASIFAGVICMMISYDEEVVTEEITTTTTETDSDIAQNIGDGGSNVYTNGDYYGNAEDTRKENNNHDNG